MTLLLLSLPLLRTLLMALMLLASLQLQTSLPLLLVSLLFPAVVGVLAFASVTAFAVFSDLAGISALNAGK
jgi:hypothetical protein